ncbi:hypothetical protein [Fibrobacter sp.]|nr:hypothetical protein [Fibrobacter sp.]MBR4008481.1 hypothetical protein [Fibrobacter sp.]
MNDCVQNDTLNHLSLRTWVANHCSSGTGHLLTIDTGKNEVAHLTASVTE